MSIESSTAGERGSTRRPEPRRRDVVEPPGSARDADGTASADLTDAAGAAHPASLLHPVDALEALLRLPVPETGFLRRAGLPRRVERAMDASFGLVLYALVVGWVYALAHPPGTVAQGEGEPTQVQQVAANVAAALSTTDAPTVAYLNDAFINALLARQRGVSGKLRARIDTSTSPLAADSLPPGAEVRYTAAGGVPGKTASARPAGAGVWGVALEIGNAVRPVADFSVITMLPFSAKRGGRIGLYFLGNWPAERGRVGTRARAPVERYANPTGFIQVTPENEDTWVSEHFRLRDFLTHDQPNVWPKYLVLQPRLLDKLELVLTDLQQRGFRVDGVRVMSGFRTPRYNAGGGNTAGRAGLSRHMYGDASDIFIDNDGDGQMDDLDHDGRVSIDDARVILQSVDRVEQAHPELVGGAGVYVAGPGHGPFIHIDARGYRARWVGGPGGG